MAKTEWRSFEEAREYIRGLGLSSTEWAKWCKSGERPKDISTRPDHQYKTEWGGWGDWLGTGSTYKKRGHLKGLAPLPFEKAREYAQGLGLKNYAQWCEWRASGKRPHDIPSNPDVAYKDKWRGWGDWLGTGRRRVRTGGLRAFEEAREYARGQGLQSSTEWMKWCKSGERPDDIPVNPPLVYKDQWHSWGDWLGTDHVRGARRPFEEAKEYVRGLGLKNSMEWYEWCKAGKRPRDIPAKPDIAYKSEWRGWSDWLGGAGYWTRRALLALLEDLRPQLPYLTEPELLAIISQHGALPTLMKKFGTTSPLAVIKDLKENDGLDVEAAVRGSEDEDVPVVGDEELVGEEITTEVADVLDGERTGGGAVASEAVEGALPAVLSRETLRAVDDLANLPGGLDDETAEYLIGNRVAALWDGYIKGEPPDGLLAGEGGYYFNLIRSRFETERGEVFHLPVPESWRFHTNGSGVLPPLPMQKRTAYQVLTKKRVGNWSGAGAGKTNAALLAIRVTESHNALIAVANATVEGWVQAIQNTFPDTVIHTAPTQPLPARFNVTILNYEKFQQPDRGELARRLRDLAYDFFILDEVQLAKQRNSDKSRRRETLEGLVQHLAENNPDLKVLGMSATPVINNLYEARKLLEIVQGRSFGDLDPRPTVMNALAVHRALMVYGFRYKPEYDIELGEPEILETVRNDLIDELRSASGVLGVEQVLLPAKLEALRPHVREGTLIYSHYVNGMIYPTRRFLEAMGWRVGVYTGEDKTGLDAFREGRVDVLIGSQPISTGVDGLQEVSNRIIVLSPPWTGAEYEQLLGRVWRQGSAFESVDIIWPQVILEHGEAGDRWSWDARRKQIIDYKRTLSDCAVDGNIPTAHSINPTTLLKKSREALEEWIERLKADGYTPTERPVLQVPLPPELREQACIKHGDFTEMNTRWSNSNSTTIHERLRADPSEWELYHTLYAEAREKWEEIPAEHIAESLKARPDLAVADFGCGTGLLKDALPGHDVVGLDHVAIDDSVIACDLSSVPLESASKGAVVLSLALMGRNYSEYLAEAYRVLQPFGLLFVSEPDRRWKDLGQTIAEHGFDVIRSYQRGNFVYVQGVKGGETL